jgi:hypothetical protein
VPCEEDIAAAQIEVGEETYNCTLANVHLEWRLEMEQDFNTVKPP